MMFPSSPRLSPPHSTVFFYPPCFPPQ
jgi:hypothetical protein